MSSSLVLYEFQFSGSLGGLGSVLCLPCRLFEKTLSDWLRGLTHSPPLAPSNSAYLRHYILSNEKNHEKDYKTIVYMRLDLN